VGTVLLLGLAAALVAFGVAMRRNGRHSRSAAAATVAVHCDGETVSRTMADGRHEEVRWDEVVAVEVFTTAVGVHKQDGVVLVLAGVGEDGCLMPSQLAVQHGVIDRLHALPGFDSRRLIAAMEKAPPSRTTCWERAEQ
jgi:hypothetical protein